MRVHAASGGQAREPLESAHITISRAARQAYFPARFQLIAAASPCLCGHFGSNGNKCRCMPDYIARYQDKISGPLLDRIDMQIQGGALPHEDLLKQAGVAEHANSLQISYPGDFSSCVAIPLHALSIYPIHARGNAPA